MAATFERRNTEESFVFASVFEFVKTWASGQKSSLLLECDNGQAWLQLGFRLSQPSASHVPSYRGSQPSKRRHRKSPSKVKRDRDRAAIFNSSKMKFQDQNVEEKSENATAASSTLCSSIDDLQEEPMCAIPPARKSKLSMSTSAQIDIPPVDLPPPNLSIQIQPAVSIPPRTVYHPAIINACQEMFGKTPGLLNHEEVCEFKYY